MGALKDPLKNRCNLKGVLTVCTYHFLNELKEFSCGISHKGWKDYQGLINDTYHGRHVETDHHFICSIPEDVAKLFALPNYITLVPGTLREVLENDTTPRYKISLKGLGMKKVKSGGASMMLKIVMEVNQDYTVFDYVPPRPQKELISNDITTVAGPEMNPAPKHFLPGHSKEKVGK